MRYLILFFLLSSCLLSVGQIKISKEKGFDPSVYKTFAVEKGQVICLIRDRKLNENKIFEIVKEAVTQELTLRGYQLVDDSVAQLTVSYVYQEKYGAEAQKPGPLGQTPINDPATIDGSYSLSRAGEIHSLIIDIEKNNDSVWTAECTLSEEQKDLNKAFSLTIESALRKFPKQSEKKKKR